jgi:hypothetical protein
LRISFPYGFTNDELILIVVSEQFTIISNKRR